MSSRPEAEMSQGHQRGESPTEWKRGDGSFCLCLPGCTTIYGSMESES